MNSTTRNRNLAAVITREQYEQAYSFGRDVHKQKIGISEARLKLEKLGLNPNSAAALVYNVGHFLDGKRYTRAMSIAATGDYLAWILRDYGMQALRNSLSALRQHIGYYETLGGGRMVGLKEVLAKYETLMPSEDDFFVSPEERTESDSLKEGQTRTILVDVHERNSKARKLCIEEYGAICAVCGFDFGKAYGAIGIGFIHVHHLREISTVEKEYEVDPKKDLRPVCPNCHAMLHKSKPAYSIEELKELIDAHRSRNR